MVFGGEALFTASALLALISFAHSGAEAADVGAVARSPGPDAFVGYVGGAEAGAAGGAEPDAEGVAGAGGAGEGGVGELFGFGGGGELAGVGRVGVVVVAAAAVLAV